MLLTSSIKSSNKKNGCTSTEFQIQKQIVDYLKVRRIPCFRTNVSYRKGHAMAKESVGVPDIVGVAPDGKFIGIEVKKPGGVVSDEQRKWLADIERSKGIAIIAFSVDDVLKRL